jgi:hypothetical protein
MTRTRSELATTWERAASVLGVEVVAPFTAKLADGSQVVADVLIKRFGGPNGMLLITDYSKVRHKLNALRDAGLGFSVLEEPNKSEPFVVDEFIELLRDWGWAGDKGQEPSWMRSS